VVTPVRFGITTNDFTFTTPGPGRYAFHCDVHPATMKGIMVIEEGAPLPGQ
jgi:plastocyanin